jgi:defect-in-organelle-trafficking protein DotD
MNHGGHDIRIGAEDSIHAIDAKPRFCTSSMKAEKDGFIFRCLVLFLGGIGMMSLVSGCATSSDIRFHGKNAAVGNGDPSARVLSRAALRISRDWDRLLAYQSHLPPTALGISRFQRTGTMGRRFTMKYVGPVEPFLSKIGKTIRWKLSVIGQKPASQPMIEIRAKSESLYDVLRDAGVQVSPGAWIVLRPEGREIDLVYPPPLSTTDPEHPK